MRIGIDLGGTKTEGILIADDGQEAHRLRRPTPGAAGYESVLGVVVEIVEALDRVADQSCPVGIGTPGALSARTDTVRNSNTTCLNGRPIHRDLSRRLGRPVKIENDANCFALSEAHDGAGAGYQTVFGIIMGTGVGGGIVCDGTVLNGRHHIAGEWGHNNLVPDGPSCYCGRRGCVETLLSGPGLLNNYSAEASQKFRDATHLLSSDDPLSKPIVEAFLDNFARAVAVVINILDPDVIVLGGGLSNFDRLYTETPARIGEHVFSDFFETPVLKNLHGDSSGVRGAAWLTIDQP